LVPLVSDLDVLWKLAVKRRVSLGVEHEALAEQPLGDADGEVGAQPTTV